ncbi:hypothetical protein R6Q57_006407 [Mikania cordata]
MGGLGKTTLVTKVYNDQTIQWHFDCWAWVSVSQTNGVEELLRTMIKKLLRAKHETIPSDLGLMTYIELVEMLIEYLHKKRYVIILDDVWNILLWSRIRNAFPENGLGSRVIFTTRNDNIAKSVGPGKHILHLDPLGEDDSWALFCKKAFWNDSEWKKIYDSLNWELSNNPVLENVKGILSLSFNDLPFYLKHCFLYCCVFHDGYPIKRKKLIRLWVAEGFIIERKGITIEEVAEEYLMELSLRSMIQVTETNDTGRVKTFRVHDVMRELAMTASKNDHFCTIYDGTEAKIVSKVQRFSVYSKGENINLCSSLSRHLRAFFVFQIEINSDLSINGILSSLKLLRVLDLEATSTGVIPNSIGDIFNLRYLNLRGTNINSLPGSIQRLRNLQTLNVRNTHLDKLPNEISNIPRLRHQLLGYSKASNLHSGLWVPAEITKIQSLKTLASIEAEEELIQKVGNLTELKRLDITKLALVGKLSRLPPWLESLSNLTHLYLSCSSIGEDIDMLSSIQKLPVLAYVELNNACKCRFLHFKAGGFPKLNKMKLLELKELVALRLEKGTLPIIKELSLIRCREMRSTLQ